MAFRSLNFGAAATSFEIARAPGAAIGQGAEKVAGAIVETAEKLRERREKAAAEQDAINTLHKFQLGEFEKILQIPKDAESIPLALNLFKIGAAASEFERQMKMKESEQRAQLEEKQEQDRFFDAHGLSLLKEMVQDIPDQQVSVPKYDPTGTSIVGTEDFTIKADNTAVQNFRNFVEKLQAEKEKTGGTIGREGFAQLMGVARQLNEQARSQMVSQRAQMQLAGRSALVAQKQAGTLELENKRQVNREQLEKIRTEEIKNRMEVQLENAQSLEDVRAAHRVQEVELRARIKAEVEAAKTAEEKKVAVNTELNAFSKALASKIHEDIGSTQALMRMSAPVARATVYWRHLGAYAPAATLEYAIRRQDTDAWYIYLMHRKDINDKSPFNISEFKHELKQIIIDPDAQKLFEGHGVGTLDTDGIEKLAEKLYKNYTTFVNNVQTDFVEGQ